MDPDGIVPANTGDPPDVVLPAVAPLDQVAAQATPPPATLMTYATAVPARFEVSKLSLGHSVRDGTPDSQGLPLEPATPPRSPAAHDGQRSYRRRPPPLVDVTGADAGLGAASTGSVKSTRSSEASPVRRSLHTVDGIPPGVRLEGYLYLLLDQGTGPTTDAADWRRRYCIFLPTHRIMFVLLHPKQARPLLECHGEDVDNAEALFRVDEMPVPQLWRRGSGRGQRKCGRQQRPPRRPSRIGQSIRGLFSSKRAPPVVHFVSNNLTDVLSIDEPLVIDLANSWARELHPSVCTDVLDGTAFFQISHGTSRTLFRCQHGLEQSAWLGALQEAVVPVNESVGINYVDLELVKFSGAASARHAVYQCEARVGSFVEAVSTKKARSGPEVTWNERFCLHNLTGAAAGQSVSIVIYRWLDPRQQHLNSARDLVGIVEISLLAGEGSLQSCSKPLESLSSAAASPIADATFHFVPQASAARGALFVRWCRREVTVRPLEYYEAMTTHVMSHPAEVSKSMEQFEEHFQEPADSDNLLVLYEAMVCMLAAKTSSVSSFLIELVLQYAKSNPPGPKKPFTFRGNSCASRALEQYIVLNARDFIQRLLHDSIKDACDDVARNGPCPVAGPGLKASEIETNVQRVRYHVEHIWNTIMKAQGRFPANIRVLFHTLTLKLVKAKFTRSVADTILCSTVALRFIVRCVASPTDVDILQHKPNRALHEFLAKIAKVLTALFHGSQLTPIDPLNKLNDTFLIPERQAGRANDFFETLRTPPLATRHSELIPKPNLRHFSAMFQSIVDRYTDSHKCPWSAELCHACRNPETSDTSLLEVGDEDMGPKRTPSSATSIATSIAPVTSVPEYAKSLRSAGVCDESSEADDYEDLIRRSISAPVNTRDRQSRYRFATSVASSAPVMAASNNSSAGSSSDADQNQTGSKHRRLFPSVHRRSRKSGVHELPPPCEADETGHSMALTKGGLRLHNTLLQAQTDQPGVQQPEGPSAAAKPDVQTALV